jgi:hypothetical protein
MKAIMKEFKLTFLSLTYAMNLIVKSILNNRTFICFTKATPKVLGVSNSPIVRNYVLKNPTLVNEIDDQGKSVMA